ncbi:MAG: hypothetical protein GY850_42870 [bacterium]|nr:hypothetical protein [bacterium]
MIVETTKFIKIDLNQFKLHLYLKQEAELTLHFDSPSRRFYLSVIGLVVHEMKKRGRITSIALPEQLDVPALFNKTVGASAGSSKKSALSNLNFHALLNTELSDLAELRKAA